VSGAAFGRLRNCAHFAFWALRLTWIPVYVRISYQAQSPLALAGVGRLFFASPGGQIMNAPIRP
jgi:hypothetical protein